MANPTLHYRETNRATITFQLLENSVPIDLTNVDKVEIVLVPENGEGTAVKFNTDDDTEIEIQDADQGKVGFTPGADTLSYDETPYRVYFNVYPDADSPYAVPDDDDDVVIMHVTEGH